MGSRWRIGVAVAAWLVLGWLWLPQATWQVPLQRAWAALQPGGASAHRCVPTDPKAPASAALYSTEACPPGTRAVALKGGTVNVVPATPVAPASAASATPVLRQLVDPAEAAALRDKRMNRVIGE
jgi:hypothetical protein